MKSDWEEVELIKICDEIVDCINKTAPIVNYKTSYKMIRTTNVKKGIVDTENVRYVTKEIYEKWIRRSIPQYGDVILTREAPLGEVGMITVHNEKIFLGQRLMSYRTNSEKLNNHFLLYSLQGIYMQWQIKSFASGSTVQHIRVGDAEKIKIKLPPLSIQKKIAHILSTLDDKIELNRKMNQTLEEMAQALFKSWFVDFDPVHARANSKESDDVVARELGISVEVMKLFPSAFVESELGLIPEGWGNDYLKNFVEILDSKRKPMSKMEREKKKGDIPYYGATSIMDYVDDYIFDEPLTLIGEDGSVARKNGTPFMQYIWGKSWINNHAHVLKSKSTLSTEAIYIALLKQNVSMFITGAVQPKINQTNLKKIPIIRPSKNLHKVYSELIEPIFSKIRQLKEETEALQKTRDTLLPKLLSGELDISKIEEKK